MLRSPCCSSCGSRSLKKLQIFSIPQNRTQPTGLAGVRINSPCRSTQRLDLPVERKLIRPRQPEIGEWTEFFHQIVTFWTRSSRPRPMFRRKLSLAGPDRAFRPGDRMHPRKECHASYPAARRRSVQTCPGKIAAMPKPLLFVAVVAAFMTPVILVVGMKLASTSPSSAGSAQQTANRVTLMYFYSPS